MTVTDTGQVTVIGTGNTPLAPIQQANPRTISYDVPLLTLNTTFSNITTDISPIASAQFASVFGELRSGTLTDEQLQMLRAQIAGAKAKGIGIRYWDTPGWPVSVRNGIWETLWREGVTLVNVDDLVAGAGYTDVGLFW